MPAGSTAFVVYQSETETETFATEESFFPRKRFQAVVSVNSDRRRSDPVQTAAMKRPLTLLLLLLLLLVEDGTCPISPPPGETVCSSLMSPR